jgi:hypothetical protein
MEAISSIDADVCSSAAAWSVAPRESDCADEDTCRTPTRPRGPRCQLEAHCAQRARNAHGQVDHEELGCQPRQQAEPDGREPVMPPLVGARLQQHVELGLRHLP